jgi:hypothetical protein
MTGYWPICVGYTGEISGLLARTDTPPAQALTAAEPEPKAAQNGKTDQGR